MAVKLNPFTGKFDFTGDAGEVAIPELQADPASPTAEQAWVLASGGADTGSPLGLLLCLTSAADVSAGPFYFSYRTTAGTTVRTLLT